MKKVLSLVIATILVLGITQVAFAKPLYVKPYYPKTLFRYKVVTPPFWGQNLIKLLNLTDEQIEKVKELREKYYNKSKELQSKLQDAMFSLRQLQLQRQPDKSQIESKKDEINSIKKEIRNVLNEYWKEFKSILTKEQLSKLDKARITLSFRARRAPWGYRYPFFRW